MSRIGRPPTHGKTNTREFQCWSRMRARCRDKNHQDWPRYGGRGIAVCERWDESFEAFLADMGPRPAGHSIDRIDNTKGYGPDNCRWATPKEQAMNRRNSFGLVFEGRPASMRDIALAVGMHEATLRYRLVNRHMSLDDAIMRIP